MSSTVGQGPSFYPFEPPPRSALKPAKSDEGDEGDEGKVSATAKKIIAPLPLTPAAGSEPPPSAPLKTARSNEGSVFTPAKPVVESLPLTRPPGSSPLSSEPSPNQNDKASAVAEAVITSSTHKKPLGRVSELGGVSAVMDLFRQPVKESPIPYKEPALIREIPLVPTEDLSLNAEQADRWVRRFDAPLQPLVGRLLASVRYVPYEEFLTSLRASLTEFEKSIPESAAESAYLSVFESNKSSFWITQHANQFLTKKPSLCIEFGSNAKNYARYLDELRTRDQRLPSHIVFFEDASYSGRQMSDYLENLLNATHFRLKKDESLPRISIICPYMTDFSLRKIYSIQEKFPELQLSIFRSTKIETIAERMGPADSTQLAKLFWSKEMLGTSETGEIYYSNPYAQGPHSRGNIWFQHKVPNLFSFVEPLVSGTVYTNAPYSSRERYLVNKGYITLPNPPDYRARKKDSQPLIREPTPVYKDESLLLETEAASGQIYAGIKRRF